MYPTTVSIRALKRKRPAKALPWEDEILELRQFFSGRMIQDPVCVDKVITVVDSKLFIETSFETITANAGNETFRPYLDRLIKFKEAIIRQENQHGSK